jgi:hypothetical protein
MDFGHAILIPEIVNNNVPLHKPDPLGDRRQDFHLEFVDPSPMTIGRILSGVFESPLFDD